ncbi:MAG: septum formation initiator family protein [Candidatus Saganbacteria bacterium]|nr:septum formation initiator family protein [Candidatus Saganbacteria bacterium]
MKRYGLLLFILLVLYFIFLIRQDIIDNLELKREQSRLETSLDREKVLGRGLRQRLDALKQDSEIEKLARLRLGLVKKDETAFKIIK